MPVAKSGSFRSGASKAAQTPRGVAFHREVAGTIVRSSAVPAIHPTKLSTKEMLERLAALPGPGSIEVRDVEPFPEPPGL